VVGGGAGRERPQLLDAGRLLLLLDGRNEMPLEQQITAAKVSGVTAVVIDQSRVERAVAELGTGHVGLVGVSGQPREVLMGAGSSFDSVAEAVAAVK